MKWADVEELVEQPSVLAALDIYEKDPGRQNAATVVFAVVRAHAARAARKATTTVELLIEYQPLEGPAVLLNGRTLNACLRQAQVEARKAPGGTVSATLVCEGCVARRVAAAIAPLEFGTWAAGREWSKTLSEFEALVLVDEDARQALSRS